MGGAFIKEETCLYLFFVFRLFRTIQEQNGPGSVREAVKLR